MLLNVRHVTQYVYDEPVRESVMEVWMQPLRTLTQTPISFELSVDPAVKAFNYADVYGNQVHHFDVPQPHNKLRIESHATVETVAATPLSAALGLARCYLASKSRWRSATGSQAPLALLPLRFRWPPVQSGTSRRE